MNRHLQQAFNHLGINDPMQYVQDTIDRLTNIDTALKKEQDMSKVLMSRGVDPTLSQAKAFLESLKK